MDKLSAPCGSSNTCWQPESSLCDAIPYTGRMSTTNQGYKCADWGDESIHKTIDLSLIEKFYGTSYCRNPDNGPDGPWCYIKNGDGTTWDYCPVRKCRHFENEFESA